MNDHLSVLFPKIAKHLRKTNIASLPTPTSSHEIDVGSGRHRVLVKHDDLTNADYGGNKVRKLEYLLQRARERGARRVATFGAVGSNHALATAIHARRIGLACTCLLGHQPSTPQVCKTLNMHLSIGTELVPLGPRSERLDLHRRYLQNRRTWVIPLGGSSWLGAVGFVNAGLELAAQIENREIEMPERIYIANGTMGSTAGLAIGLALAKLPVELHAVRVAHNFYSRPRMLRGLMLKTALLLNRLDSSVPDDIADRTKIRWRDDFFAGGYAVADDATLQAVEFAADKLNLRLDTTYTGKAMAALLSDAQSLAPGSTSLFWNTYSSRALPVDCELPGDSSALPDSFIRYFR